MLPPQTGAVKSGKHNPPAREHGKWTCAATDFKAEDDEVALLDPRVQARAPLAQGIPPASPDPPRHEAVGDVNGDAEPSSASWAA
jgi:hypothetical protein